MELERSGKEGGGDPLVHGHGQLDQGGAALLQCAGEALSSQVVRQDGAVDGVQSLGSRKGQGEDREVALWREMQHVNLLVHT